jgi:hypothetical protein
VKTAAAAAAALAAGAALVVAPASGATPAQNNTAREAHVLRFDLGLRDFQKNYVDIGTAGPGVGDLLVFQDRVFRKGTKTKVGVQGGSCIVTALLGKGFQTHCTGTVSLAGGQITFQGLVTDAPRKVMAVVGGTGNYESAAGELIFVENGDGTNSGKDDGTGTLTIDLRHDTD